MAISRYENNQSVPSSGVLLALAKSMNVRTEYFSRSEDIQLEDVNILIDIEVSGLSQLVFDLGMEIAAPDTIQILT